MIISPYFSLLLGSAEATCFASKKVLMSKSNASISGSSSFEYLIITRNKTESDPAKLYEAKNINTPYVAIPFSPAYFSNYTS